MITKEKFCEYIDKIESTFSFANKLEDLFQEFNFNVDHDDSLWGMTTDSAVDVINILEDYFDDEDGLIGEFVFELDFGNDSTDEDIQDAEELYDILNEYETIEEFEIEDDEVIEIEVEEGDEVYIECEDCEIDFDEE